MKRLVVIVLFLGLIRESEAQDRIFAVNGLAIRGYDPVAYFTEGKAVKGSPVFSLRWKETNWQFASAAHRDTFRENPERYLPQFGGYCAYGASEDHLSPTDPEAWTLADGKLYLNFNKQVKNAWLPDTAKRIPAARNYWKSIQQ